MNRYSRRGRSVRSIVERLADEVLPADWRQRPDWRQLRADAIEEAIKLVEERERVDVCFGGQPDDPRVADAVRAALGGYTPGAGEYVHLVVAHDYECSYLQGGRCQCVPDVQVRAWKRERGAAA